MKAGKAISSVYAVCIFAHIAPAAELAKVLCTFVAYRMFLRTLLYVYVYVCAREETEE
jgi:hypothetical protein